jgi:hypothetical protein
MAAGEVVAEFVGHEDYQKRYGKRQAIQKRRRMAVSETEGLDESVERNGLIVRVGGGEMRPGEKGCEQRQKKQCGCKGERTSRRMQRDGLIIGGGRWRLGPRRRLRENGSAFFRFRRIHENLLGDGRVGVFQSLKFFAGLETNRFARRNADFFAGAGIAPDAGFSRLDAEDSEFAELDALAATERALQRFEDGFYGLLRFGAADVGLCHHSIYDVELDHNRLQCIRARC